MYFVPNMYPNSYYVNSIGGPIYNARNGQLNTQQVLEALYKGLYNEASAVNLYQRLASVASNQLHKNVILHTLEDKKNHLQQFTNAYITVTGTRPMYQHDTISFQTYKDGVHKAYDLERKVHEEYRNSYERIQHPVLQNVFLQILSKGHEHWKRFEKITEEMMELTDFGADSFVITIDEATKQNNNYRTALWTGSYLQVTLMSIVVGGDIGLEVHPNLDQFIRIEQGQGIVRMGDRKDDLDFEEKVYDDYAFVIPAGKWHNLINTGDEPIKLYSIYAPPQHPFGTVHETKEIAMLAEEHHD